MWSARSTEHLVNWMLRGITRVLCRIDDSQLPQVPQTGPLILATNHVNFLEVPIVYTHLQPRPVTGFAKAETWDNRLMGMLFDLWEAIPIERGEADLGALRLGLSALKAGQILAVAPEGTRSGDGILQEGHPGIVLMALKSKAPILPLVVYGGERFWHNFRQLKRTNFSMIVGNPFYLRQPSGKTTRQERHAMLTEIMFQLAGLLPAQYRGRYAALENSTTTFLVFPPGSSSNLP